MTTFLFRSGAALVSALVLVSSPSAALAQAENYTFAFQNADIQQVAEEVFGQAGVAFAVDPGVSGKLTFRIEQRLTRDQLLAAFEAVLAAQGIAMVRQGQQLVLTPQAQARSAAGIRQGAEGLGTAGYEVVALPLSYAQPTEVARAMEAISGTKAVIYANDKLGLLLLGGTGQQLRSAMETLKVFDQNAFQDSKIRWLELSQAQAGVVAGELERIVEGAALVGVVIVPLKRLNGLIVFARSTEALDEISRWTARLDTAGREVTSSLWVYRPQNSSAEALAKTLNGVLGYQSSVQSVATLDPAGPSSGPATVAAVTTSAFGDAEVRIGVDRDTNTLLVLAAPSHWLQIQRILSEIDRPPRQIFIEASILEVALGKDFQFGVDWSVVSEDVAVRSINNSSGVVAASFPGLSITYFSDDIDAAVRALGARTQVEVISAPKIVALDNRTARLQIGDQVPVVVQASQSTQSGDAALVTTVDYRSTGVILTVTPRITGDDKLVLEVSQEVSSVAKTVTSGIDSPTIQQRRFDSTLVLHDGGVVALGGLISSNTSHSRSGVPGLMSVPGLGALFSSSSQNNSRSELIVLLSAKILSDRATADRAMADLAADMRELQIRGLLPTTP